MLDMRVHSRLIRSRPTTGLRPAILQGIHPGLARTRHGSCSMPSAVVMRANQQQQDGSSMAQVDNGLALFARQVEDKSFFCTQCGKCCTGAGEVWISPADADRISSHLGVSLEQFGQVYCKEYKKYKGWFLLKNRAGTQDCIFLDGKLCGIHTVRPSQCSTYPWWPELMEKEGWDWEKQNICEGFDHPDAPSLDVQSAATQLQQATRDEQLRKLARVEKDNKLWGLGSLFKDISAEP